MAENENQDIQPKSVEIADDQGALQMRKRSAAKKFASDFIKEDAKNIKSYIFKDVIGPSLRDLLFNIGNNILSMVFYGNPDSGYRSGRTNNRPWGSVTYRNTNTPYSSISRRDTERRERARYDDDEYYDLEEDATLKTKGQALDFKYELENALDEYKVLSINDYKDILNDMFPQAQLRIRPSDKNYGWTSLARISIERTRDGRYMVCMPKAMPID